MEDDPIPKDSSLECAHLVHGFRTLIDTKFLEASGTQNKADAFNAILDLARYEHLNH